MSSRRLCLCVVQLVSQLANRLLSQMCLLTVAQLCLLTVAVTKWAWQAPIVLELELELELVLVLVPGRQRVARLWQPRGHVLATMAMYCCTPSG